MATTDTPVIVNDQTFDWWVLKSELPVAVLFCTDKFPRCREMEPLWRQLARDYAGRLRVARIHVDDNREWARRYGITALPTTLWLREGDVKQKAEGVPEPAVLRERAEALLANRDPRLPERPRPSAFDSTGGPVKLTDATLPEAIRDERPLLVDFWAEWCGPCHMIAPAVEALAREVGQRALIGKLNIDENPRSARQYQVMSIPTLLIFRNGKVVDRIVGAQPAPVLRQRLQAHLTGG